MGISELLGKFFGNKSDKDIKELMPLVEKTKEEYAKLQQITNDELRQKTLTIKKDIIANTAAEEEEIIELKLSTEGEDVSVDQKEEIFSKVEKIEKEIKAKIEEKLKEVLPEVYAIVKETARRFHENDELEVTAMDLDRDIAAVRNQVEIRGNYAYWKTTWLAGGNEVKWDMVHFDVQIIGGIVLHDGKISEMATGEGKTLVATFPVFLNALAGKGVHIVTVNDYLAKRDSEWMGPIFEFHGLKVDCIDKHQPNSAARRNAYMADITYGTNNEFGFDYLRDNMALSPDDIVQRPHHYAIVDEVDSVLIDDARTPLIISGPTPKGDDQMFQILKPKVEKLVDAQKKLVAQLMLDAKRLIKEEKNEEGGKLLLRAFKGLPKNNNIIKFLSETGMKTLMLKVENTYLADNQKRMPEITEDLYFVIDEKNNSVDLTDKGIDLITGSSDDPEFFILPDIGSRIADIEKNNSDPREKAEMKDVLMRDYSIKSERVHTINQLLKAYTMFDNDVEYVVLDNKVKIVDEQTGRILEGRRYSDGLHQAIEAKENVKVEAATQKLAGMTGTAETEAGEFWSIYKLDVVVIPTHRKIVRKDHEDLIYKTKREKYFAVVDEINRLIGEGRPVLVGTTSVEVSELLSRILKQKGIKHNVLNAKYHQKEAEIIVEAGKSRTVTIATNMAGRGTDIKLSPEVRNAGGLAIIGTERHESRRVDRQLRGRAGRQGDPGSSQFYVSLEDDLMRLFGSDRIARMMDRMGLKEGEVIQHSMITKSIERAQRKVEENNFGIRKRLLEYDDVMNNQREVIYSRRRNALYGQKLAIDLANAISDVSNTLVLSNHGSTEFEEFELDCIRTLSVECPISREQYLQMQENEIIEILNEKVYNAYREKSAYIAKQANPVIKDVYEKSGSQYKNILVPVSDGKRIFQVITPLQKAYENEGKELCRSYEKTIALVSIDDAWKEHLRELDDLKQAVQAAAYEQKDPLLIYKFESYELFKRMIDKVNREIVYTLMKAHIPISDPSQVREAQTPKKLDLSKLETGRSDGMGGGADGGEKRVQPVRAEKKVGRNDPCPCGSGKKYKNCHGKDAVG